jgi:hypothetical protein
LLSFQQLQGSHTGEKLAEEIYNALDQYNIIEKLFCITTDNASNNSTAMTELSSLLLTNKGSLFVSHF